MEVKITDINTKDCVDLENKEGFKEVTMEGFLNYLILTYSQK